ncbi:hypothetical protein H0X06_04445 [Candidatus Dependentiae bacterium]|nr:hypothetical protein [Candidatus Dependentiae bacterium]
MALSIKSYIGAALIVFFVSPFINTMDSLTMQSEEEYENNLKYDEVYREMVGINSVLNSTILTEKYRDLLRSRSLDLGEKVYRLLYEEAEGIYNSILYAKKLMDSIDELYKNKSLSKEEEKKLLSAKKVFRKVLGIELRLYKITLQIFDGMQTLLYNHRLKQAREEIDLIDELLKKLTLPTSVGESLLPRKEDLLKTIILFETKEKEVIVKKNKVLLLIKDCEVQGGETDEDLDNLEVNYLDKDTHELACSLQ